MLSKKPLYALGLALLLTGCDTMHMDLGWAKAANLDMTPPPGPAIYQQGFVEGCESGLSGYATYFNKIWHDYKQDPQLAKNPVYYKIWKDAYSYCQTYGMMQSEHTLGNWK